MRQTHRNNCIVSESHQSFGTANPNVALTILEEPIGESPGEAVLFIERLQFAVMRTELSISQALGMPDSYDSRVHTRDPQGAVAIYEQIMQTIFGDRWILCVRVMSRDRDRPYLPPAVLCQPHSPVFSLRQCCNTRPGRSAQFERFRTSPQAGND